GWGEVDVLGKPLPTIPSEHRHELQAIMERVKQGESFTARPSERLRKDGRPVIISLSVAPLRDAQGRVEGLLSVVDDITEKKEAEAALARHHALLPSLLHSIPDLIAPQHVNALYP